jgi:subtilase family serine protease
MRTASLLAVSAFALAGCSPYHADSWDFRFEVPASVTPADPVVGDPFEIRFRARNGGDIDADNVRWKLFRDGTAYATGVVDLHDHESRDVAVLVSGDTEGVHHWVAELDPDDFYAEEEEDNNASAVTVVVGPDGRG